MARTAHADHSRFGRIVGRHPPVDGPRRGSRARRLDRSCARDTGGTCHHVDQRESLWEFAGLNCRRRRCRLRRRHRRPHRRRTNARRAAVDHRRRHRERSRPRSCRGDSVGARARISGLRRRLVHLLAGAGALRHGPFRTNSVPSARHWSDSRFGGPSGWMPNIRSRNLADSSPPPAPVSP